jgi:hypothetical protein
MTEVSQFGYNMSFKEHATVFWYPRNQIHFRVHGVS